MRSILITFVYAATFLTMPCNAADDWKTNVDVMDFAIAVHHHAGLNDPTAIVAVDRALAIINGLATSFQLGPDKTRMAVVEFGDVIRILVSLKDGVDPTKIAAASSQLGKQSFVTGNNIKTIAQVAVETRQMIFPMNSTDRIDVPKLVMIITDMAGGVIKRDVIRGDTIGVSDAAEQGAHTLVVNSLGRYGWNEAGTFAIVYRIIRGQPKKDSAEQYNNGMIATVAKNTRSCLELCAFKKSLSTCRINDEKKCVADVFYDLAYQDGNVVDPTRWGDVHWYCFKNGSTTLCPTGDLGCQTSTTTSTTTTTEEASPSTSFAAQTQVSSTGGTKRRRRAPITVPDDSNVYYPDDPIVVNLKMALISLGIACAFGVPAAIASVFYALRVRREVMAEEKKAKLFAGGSGIPGWTVNMPPDVTQTAPDDLVKRYAAKKA